MRRNFLWAMPLITAAGLAAFTTARANQAEQSAALAQVLLGRELVITHDCNGCHGGIDPSRPGWLDGVRDPIQIFKLGPKGVCDSTGPCWATYPRNLTPDNATGLGRFTERQIYNALKYGLRPEDTPDVEITGTTPGQGNFPARPHYLAPPMPWPAWRHMSDTELRAIAAYLRRGLKPSTNKVPDSEGPPDFWAGFYAANIGPATSPPFPAEYEQAPK